MSELLICSETFCGVKIELKSLLRQISMHMVEGWKKLESVDSSNSGNFALIPPDNVVEIFRYLDLDDVRSLQRTCKYLYSQGNRPELWIVDEEEWEEHRPLKRRRLDSTYDNGPWVDQLSACHPRAAYELDDMLDKCLSPFPQQIPECFSSYFPGLKLCWLDTYECGSDDFIMQLDGICVTHPECETLQYTQRMWGDVDSKGWTDLGIPKSKVFGLNAKQKKEVEEAIARFGVENQKIQWSVFLLHEALPEE